VSTTKSTPRPPRTVLDHSIVNSGPIWTTILETGALLSSSKLLYVLPTVNREAVSDCLEKALLHYSEAHKYYSRYDISPTLVLILTDMCDLYLASY
jgi:hypothetical protein